MYEMIDHEVIRRLSDLSRGLRYGSIHLVVHEGRVTQIERVEKVRLDKDQKVDQTTGDSLE